MNKSGIDDFCKLLGVVPSWSRAKGPVSNNLCNFFFNLYKHDLVFYQVIFFHRGGGSWAMDYGISTIRDDVYFVGACNRNNPNSWYRFRDVIIKLACYPSVNKRLMADITATGALQGNSSLFWTVLEVSIEGGAVLSLNDNISDHVQSGGVIHFAITAPVPREPPADSTPMGQTADASGSAAAAAEDDDELDPETRAAGRLRFLGLLPLSAWTPEERGEPMPEDDVEFRHRNNLYTDIASPTAITYQDPLS